MLLNITNEIVKEITLYRIGLILKTFFNIIIPILAILVIIKCTIDIAAIILNPDKAKENTKKATSRLIASIVVILICSLIKGSFRLMVINNENIIVKYYDKASPEIIRILENQLKSELAKEEEQKNKDINEYLQEHQKKSQPSNNGNSNNTINSNSNSNNNNSISTNPVTNGNMQVTNSPNIRKPKNNAVDAQVLLDMIPKNNIQSAQVTVFGSGRVFSSANHNTNDNNRYPISSASKMMLGIIAAKMQDDNLINLDTQIDYYWHSLYNRNFNATTSEWQSYIGSPQTLKNYTAPDIKLVENPATLRHCLTNSSSIKNMNMVHMIPNDSSSEYFGGGMSQTYSRAAFMLKHTYHQLFEQNGIPGTKTEYTMRSDNTTRDHALAGFTMQIAMNQSLNEYLNSKITSQIGSTSSPGFNKGNSIYFATSYYSSANDLAKIISAVANNGVYDGKRIFSTNAITEIEKVYGNLNNQTIAFEYQGGKYVKYGNYPSTSIIGNYGISSEISNNSTYISYDPVSTIGFVVNIKYNNTNDKNNSINTYGQLSNYFYSNS